MRSLIAALILVAAVAAPARADGTMSLRGVWYKEKATRVIQPMIDLTQGIGENGEADAHILVDAITSASTAAGALGGDPFKERRWEIGAGYRHLIERLLLGGAARLSYEPDYTSLFFGLNGDIILADQTTTISLGAGIGHDRISKSGPTAPNERPFLGKMTTALGSVGVTQVLSRNTVAGVIYDLVYLDGYQENPYRTAITADGLTLERHPDQRLRQALAGSVRQFVPQTITTLVGLYRFYVDDWGVTAHTPEVRVIQEAGDGADVTVRYRFHLQNEADFYLPSYPSNDMDEFPFITDDIKLSSFTSHTIGIKFGIFGRVLGFDGKLEDARGEVTLEYLDQNNRFGNAVTAHAALTLPLGD